VPTYLNSGGGADTVNVGFIDCWDIKGTLYVENTPNFTTLNIFCLIGQTYTISTITPLFDPVPWGSITGLSPAAINYEVADIGLPNFFWNL
jgi:hypothetical protein